ncbi:unnamed protein product [Spodoptera exigua]|nr:unnamed protein product [Spodoptera exigua]
MCDCLEEKQRKERERAKKLAARGFRGGLYGPAGGAYDGLGPDSGAFSPESGGFDEYGNWVPPRDPPSHFTPVRIALGTAGLLFLTFFALFLKLGDKNSSPIHRLYFSYFPPKPDPNAPKVPNYCFDPKKKKWPPEPIDKDGS